MAELIEKYQENKNFAPKQNERDCPMTCVTGQINVLKHKRTWFDQVIVQA